MSKARRWKRGERRQGARPFLVGAPTGPGTCGRFPICLIKEPSLGARTAPGPSARPTRAAPAQREPTSLGSCRLLCKMHGPCNPPARPAGPTQSPCSFRRADAIPALILQGRRNPRARFAGPMRFPARFAGPVHGVERSGPVCGALCSERRGMSRRTGKSRSSRRALARICPKRRAVKGFACVSPAKRALEAPFPVRRARALHFEQAGGVDRAMERRARRGCKAR